MKISIKTFQELHTISQTELPELEKSILLIRALTGKNEVEIDRMKTSKFNALCRKVQQTFELMHEDMMNDKPKRIVRTNGRLYQLNYEIAKTPMNAGRYVEIATFSNDIIGNLHKIMATMATPLKMSWKGYVPETRVDYMMHERIANDMLHLEFKVAYHSALFFWAVFSKSIQNSHNYFLSIAEDKNQMNQLLIDLQNILDGFTQPNWLRTLKISV